jgi:putative transposase
VGGRLYVCVDEWFVYVAFVIDAFSRRIVGWRVGTSMSTALVQDAVGHAFFTRAQEGTISLHGLIAHNDAGSQGGFNRSSQHRVVNLSVVGRQALPPVFSTRVFYGAGC